MHRDVLLRVNMILGIIFTFQVRTLTLIFWPAYIVYFNDEPPLYATFQCLHFFDPATFSYLLSFKTNNKNSVTSSSPPHQQMLKTLSFKCSLRETKSVFSLILLKELQQGILPNFRDYVTWQSFCTWFTTIPTILGRSYSHSKLIALVEPSFSYFSIQTSE